MKTSIFVVSFKRDLPFVGYLCRSYEKFCTGFHEFVIMVPRQDHEAFIPFVKRFGVRLSHYEDDTQKPFLMHQVVKLSADDYCEGDYIMHVDSDCVFWQPCTPEFYFRDGKPILYRERFDTVVNKMRQHWRTAVRDAVGIDCEYDYMVRHPAVHHRSLYPKVRGAVELHTGKRFDTYWLSCRDAFPQSAAEHPTQGAVAERFMPEQYTFVDFDVTTPDGGYQYTKERDALLATWSHGGVDRYRQELDAIIA